MTTPSLASFFVESGLMPDETSRVPFGGSAHSASILPFAPAHETSNFVRHAISWSIPFGAATSEGEELDIVGVYESGPGAQESTLRLEASLPHRTRIGDLWTELESWSPVKIPLPDWIASATLSSAYARLEREVRAGATADTKVATTVFRLGFGLGADARTYEILPGLLSIRPERFDLTIHAKGARIRHQCWVTLFGVGWTFDVEFPALSGLLRLGSTLSLASLVEHFGLHDPGGALALLSAQSGHILVDARGGFLALHLESGGKWKLGPVELYGLKFDVGYRRGVGGGFSVAVAAAMKVGPLDLVVSVSHPGAGQGWELSGALSFEAPSGALKVSDLGEHFGLSGLSALGPLADLALKHLEVNYSTSTGTLSLGAGITLHDTFSLDLTISHGKDASGQGETRFSGTLHLGDVELDLLFDKDGSNALLVAALGASRASPNAGQLATALSLDSDLARQLSDIKLRSLLVALDKHSNTSARVLAGEIDVAIDFSGFRKLPVLGEHLPPNLRVGADVAFTACFPKTATPPDASRLAALAGSGAPQLSNPIAPGLTTHVRVQLNGHELTRSPFPSNTPLPSSAAPPATPPPTTAVTTASPTAAVSWNPVNLSLGSVIQIRRLGTEMEGTSVTLLLDGSLAFGPVSLDLLGVGVKYDLATRTPEFAFLGLGLSLSRGPARVSGAFYNVGGDFVGTAQVLTSRFGLSAVGGFTEQGGTPSLFLYGVLNAPLGGPPFFFVEGFALGFGMNRLLRRPDIRSIESFPLVALALPSASGGDVASQAAALHDWISPSRGDWWFAAGVKFNSFRMLDGFALLIVSIDTVHDTWRLDVLGNATWSTPKLPPGTPRTAAMSWVSVDVLASFVPAEGSLIVQARLSDDSFVHDPLCHLHGGLAAGFWFGGPHAGDFVVTLGGFHPAFQPPAHYPVPDRLSLDWGISDCVHVGGSLYFAITPGWLMFGFELSATWHTGPLRAWFDLGLDFLMRFKPLHYDATGHIEIGAALDTFFCTLHLSVGADLHVWGPHFAGRAHVHVGPFSATVSFGSDGGPPADLTWTEFRDHLLPSPFKEKTLTSTIAEGSLRSRFVTEAGATVRRDRVSAKTLAIEVESLVPCTSFEGWSGAEHLTGQGGLAVRPMGAPPGVNSKLKLAARLDGASDAIGEFDIVPLVKPMPSALWAKAEEHEHLVPLTGGVRITPARPPKVSETGDILRSALKYEIRGGDLPHRTQPRLMSARAQRSPAQRRLDREAIRAHLGDPATAARRSALLLHLSDSMADTELDPARITPIERTLAAMQDAPQTVLVEMS